MTKQYRLPKTFLEEWVAALKSKKYNQAGGSLVSIISEENKVIGYCCLGVACVMKGAKEEEINNLGYIEDISAEFMSSIPLEIKGNNSDNILVRELSCMNDSLAFTFEDIANWLIENVEPY